LKLTINLDNYKYISEDSSTCDSNTIFLNTFMNSKYLEDAKSKTGKIITPNELKQYIDISKIKIIGITGTNGKTTTAAAIYSFLLDLGYRVGFQGTRGFFINDQKKEGKSLTTPTLLHTYSHILQAIEDECEYFIMEVSSHAIAQKRIEGLNFELKVHTNITSDHLDFHKSLDEYIAVKNSFFTDESKKLINKDDKKVKYNYINAITYAVDNGAMARIDAFSMQGGITAAVEYFGEKESFHSPLVGFFNLYNLLAAVIAVKMVTIRPLVEICDVVENFGGVAGRLEIIHTNPTIVIDFAHTEDGMRKAFEAFDTQKIVVVFGAGGNRDRVKRAKMGAVASYFARKIYLTSDNPRDERAEDIIEDIKKGIKGPSVVKSIIDRKEAIKEAMLELKEDEVLMILGKGDETTQEINGEFYLMNDKQMVYDIIKNIAE
jgi:UDP-N-acetylmuramoyl-L-alanyl-D-glutamate--2,6-diaminopimelate ligase